MKTKFFFLLLIIISYSCSEDDGTATTITCVDNTYYALSTSDMQNSNARIDIIENTTSSISTSSFNTRNNLLTGLSIQNNPSAWDVFNRQLIWLDQEEQTVALLYNEITNSIISSPLPASSHGITGRITAPVFLNGTLYVVDMDTNPSNPRYNIHTMTPSTSVLGPVIASGFFIPGSISNDLTYTTISATTDGLNTLFFRFGDHILYFDTITSVVTTYNNIGIGSHYTSGLEYNKDKDVFYMITDNNGSVELIELKVNGLNNYSINRLYTGLNVNIESMQLEWKSCGKRLHLITHFNFGNSATAAQTDIIEFNLDASPTMISKTFNSFIVGFVHKEI